MPAAAPTTPHTAEPQAVSLANRLEKARREARLTEAVWRRKRAEVARLIAAGEEAAVARLVAEIERQAQAKPVGPTTKYEPAKLEPTKSVLALKPRATPAGADPEKAKQPVDANPQTSAKTRRSAIPTVTKPTATKPTVRKPTATKTISRNKRTAPQPLPREAIRRRNRLSQSWLASARDWTSRKPSWALSMTAHVLVLVVLALLTFGSWTEPPLSLEAAFASEADLFDVQPEAMPAVTIDAVELDAALEQTEPTEVELVALVEELAEPAQLELAAVVLQGDLLAGSAEGLMAEVGSTDSDPSSSGEGEAQAPSSRQPVSSSGTSPGGVRFFGAQDAANRVAFVVDNSGSMQRGRMETTLMELDRAVRRLSEEQYFYVVLFSDQAYPMFYPQPGGGMLPATRQHKALLSKWLGTVEMCLGGRLLDAVEMAAAVEPQVVYLLSDGDIRSTRVIGRLSDPDAWEFTIHTLGMGVRTPQDAAKLQTIASANGGVFRPVRAHPDAIRRSQIRPIPYHNTQGKVWGLSSEDLEVSRRDG